jgi:hypothetical protein
MFCPQPFNSAHAQVAFNHILPAMARNLYFLAKPLLILLDWMTQITFIIVKFCENIFCPDIDIKYLTSSAMFLSLKYLPAELGASWHRDFDIV